MNITRAELLLAGRFLELAAAEFHEHGCNDVDPALFKGVSVLERSTMVDRNRRRLVDEIPR